MGTQGNGKLVEYVYRLIKNYIYEFTSQLISSKEMQTKCFCVLSDDKDHISQNIVFLLGVLQSTICLTPTHVCQFEFIFSFTNNLGSCSFLQTYLVERQRGLVLLALPQQPPPSPLQFIFFNSTQIWMTTWRKMFLLHYRRTQSKCVYFYFIKNTVKSFGLSVCCCDDSPPFHPDLMVCLCRNNQESMMTINHSTWRTMSVHICWILNSPFSAWNAVFGFIIMTVSSAPSFNNLFVCCLLCMTSPHHNLICNSRPLNIVLILPLS